MNATQLTNAARLLAHFANNITVNIDNAKAYQFWSARYFAAKEMLYICSGIEATIVKSENGNVTIKLTDSKTYNFTFEN